MQLTLAELRASQYVNVLAFVAARLTLGSYREGARRPRYCTAVVRGMMFDTSDSMGPPAAVQDACPRILWAG
jgi:hypothetical protein